MERMLRIGGGMALVGVGLAMLVLPGPGVLAVVAGLVALRRDLPFVERFVAATERRFPALTSRFGLTPS